METHMKVVLRIYVCINYLPDFSLSSIFWRGLPLTLVLIAFLEKDDDKGLDSTIFEDEADAFSLAIGNINGSAVAQVYIISKVQGILLIT